jgi:pimeloyl-ACP methyl ester carboxylesterase
MALFKGTGKSSHSERIAAGTYQQRRELLKRGIALVSTLSVGVGRSSINAGMLVDRSPASQQGTSLKASTPALDAASEAKKIAFDRAGTGDRILLISGFPQTRLSWNRLVPLLSHKFQCIPADLPSFGDSGILAAPATTENVGRVFHEFVASLGAPLHVVAHDFGAWCAYSWALLFPGDFRSLTLIDTGIPGVTLTNEIQLSDYKRKWNFIFQMLPDLPAKLTKGREDIYVGWWFENKFTGRERFRLVTWPLMSGHTLEGGEWMPRSTIAAGSLKTRTSTRRSSRADFPYGFSQSAGNTQFRTWVKRYSLTLRA